MSRCDSLSCINSSMRWCEECTGQTFPSDFPNRAVPHTEPTMSKRH